MRGMRPGTVSRYVITGASGGLGRALISQLAARRLPIIGLDRNPSSIAGLTKSVECDIATAPFDRLIAAGDVVFHLAAFVHRLPQSEVEVQSLRETNVHATQRLALACRDAGAMLVFSSSVAVWRDPPASPDAPPSPATEYGISKALAEQAVREVGRDGLAWSIVRFPLLYGPYGRGNMERLLQAVLRGRYWPIGDQDTLKSCLFFDDAAIALTLAADACLGAIHTAAPPQCPTLRDIHFAAYAAAGRRPPRPPVPRPVALAGAEVARLLLAALGRGSRLKDQVRTLTSSACYDGSRFSEATGFRPTVDLLEGMRRTAFWMRDARAE